jgi:hypothetical protein
MTDHEAEVAITRDRPVLRSGNDRSGIGMGNDEADLVRMKAGVDRDSHQPGSKARVQCLKEFRPVCHQDGDAIARCEACPEKPVGQPGDSLVKVAIGHPAYSVAESRRVR